MNKRILSVFVFSAALLSIQAQDRKGGISDAHSVHLDIQKRQAHQKYSTSRFLGKRRR